MRPRIGQRSSVIERLDVGKISEGLSKKRIGRKVLVLGTVSSTNDIAARFAKDADNDGLVVFAEEQSCGRGRGHNRWLSGYADSILCSILLIEGDIPSPELLSLASAVATAEAIGMGARIKWPNDIFLNGKKIGGILLESKQNEETRAWIIGIGINCNQQRFDGELSDTASSIYLESGMLCDRNLLARRLLLCINNWVQKVLKEPQEVITSWSRFSILLGKRIVVSYKGKTFKGTCSGIDPEKGLVLELDCGRPRFFESEHTSIIRLDK